MDMRLNSNNLNALPPGQLLRGQSSMRSGSLFSSGVGSGAGGELRTGSWGDVPAAQQVTREEEEVTVVHAVPSQEQGSQLRDEGVGGGWGGR
jgi:hypothetical protein